MELSERDRRIIAALERDLAQEDPTWASCFARWTERLGRVRVHRVRRRLALCMLRIRLRLRRGRRLARTAQL